MTGYTYQEIQGSVVGIDNLKTRAKSIALAVSNNPYILDSKFLVRSDSAEEVGQMRADCMETFHEPEEVNIVLYPGVPLQVRIGEISEEEEYWRPIDEVETMHEITV